MAFSNVVTSDEIKFSGPANSKATASAVSWGAILAGAAAAAALSLILLILGTGLGLSSVSPWANSGIGVMTLGVSTILWLTITQLLASGMGGYIAGRLRSSWAGTQTDEIYFRDTAHGFLAWAVASLATAALLTSVVGSIVGSGIQAGASVAGGAATTAMAATTGATAAGTTMLKSDNDTTNPMNYFVDSLFRKNITTSLPSATSPGNKPVAKSLEQDSPASSLEVARIFMHTIRTGPLPPEDVSYVGQVVAQRTGLTQQEAERRVIDTYGRMQVKLNEMEIAVKEAADKTRKASAITALWLFISLLIGAFVASLAAVYGGRQRDL